MSFDCGYRRGFLEVTSDPNSPTLILSFPPPYLGDKRTAFRQALSLTLSFPRLPVGVPPVRAYVEVTSFVSRVDPLLVLLFELKVDASSPGPQMSKVRRHNLSWLAQIT